MTKKALVLGGGAFIGSHMVNRLKAEGFWVRAVDLKWTGTIDEKDEPTIKREIKNWVPEYKR